MSAVKQYAPGSVGLLAPIEPWLNDDLVSEILLNKPGEVWVEKEGRLQQFAVPELNHAHIGRLFQLIANENSQKISIETPLLSGSLMDGSRVQLCMPPTAKYHALSIRRKVVKNFTLDDYKKTSFYDEAEICQLDNITVKNLPKLERLLLELYENKSWDEFIRLAIKLKKNVVISGSTSSGKTTFLNACLREIDLEDRIIVLEDTREIEIPHKNQVNLLASKDKDQGVAKVDMQDLVQCCLRLRPDRIIMGEIRNEAIMDFVSACSTGHEGSLTTIHANNPRLAFMRMTQLYKLNHVPSMTDNDILRELKEVIDIIIQVNKETNVRRIKSIYFKTFAELNGG
jgi:type IV secretion system protein VirB11